MRDQHPSFKTIAVHGRTIELPVAVPVTIAAKSLADERVFSRMSICCAVERDLVVGVDDLAYIIRVGEHVIGEEFEQEQLSFKVSFGVGQSSARAHPVFPGEFPKAASVV